MRGGELKFACSTQPGVSFPIDQSQRVFMCGCILVWMMRLKTGPNGARLSSLSHCLKFPKSSLCSCTQCRKVPSATSCFPQVPLKRNWSHSGFTLQNMDFMILSSLYQFWWYLAKPKDLHFIKFGRMSGCRAGAKFSGPCRRYQFYLEFQCFCR